MWIVKQSITLLEYWKCATFTINGVPNATQMHRNIFQAISAWRFERLISTYSRIPQFNANDHDQVEKRTKWDFGCHQMSRKKYCLGHKMITFKIFRAQHNISLIFRLNEQTSQATLCSKCLQFIIYNKTLELYLLPAQHRMRCLSMCWKPTIGSKCCLFMWGRIKLHIRLYCHRFWFLGKFKQILLKQFTSRNSTFISRGCDRLIEWNVSGIIFFFIYLNLPGH